MFDMRAKFMDELRKKHPDAYPDMPVDLTSKKSQQHLRDLALRGVEEVFEAVQHLKNWKPHRETEVADFDRAAFKEEMVDSFNYFLSLLILMGVTPDELYQAYVDKDQVIHGRIKGNY
jgi:NTP pyrophosphatase (non-canonical NTP hydrolase)